MATYAARSREPAHALWFLLAPLGLYLYWAVVVAPRQGGTLLAHSLVSDLLRFVGYNWAFMPGLAIVVVLFCIHFTEHNPFDPAKRRGFWVLPDPLLMVLMLAESAGWALPLLFAGNLIMLWLSDQHLAACAAPSLASGLAAGPLVAGVMLSIGAGIFEELVFRLIGLNMVDLFLAPLPERFRGASRVLAIALTSAAFAAAHFLTPDNPFSAAKALFYYFGGVYFAILYLRRGFGIAAGTHACFDVLVTLLMAYRG